MIRERVVVDASVAIALILDEADSAVIRATIATWLTGDIELLVPDHFWLEVINPLARRHGYDGRRLLEAVRDLDDLPITTIETIRPQHVLAIDLMDRYRLTVYDAAYLALAQAMGARLASTDRVLLEAAGDAGIDPRLPSDPGTEHRSAEEAAPYGRSERPVTWPSWPGAGAYLATLRRQATAE